MGGKGSGGYRKNALPRDKNPVVKAMDPTNVDPKANTQVIAFMKDCMSIGTPDWSDPADMERHFYDYLDVCDSHGIAPMVGAYAASMGWSPQELSGITRGDPHYNYMWRKYEGLTPESVATVQKGRDFLRISWESSMMTDKGNPAKWIFLGKNYFGMKDQSERVSFNVDVPQKLPAPEDVAAKYAAMVGRQEPKAELLGVEDVPEKDA